MTLPPVSRCPAALLAIVVVVVEVIGCTPTFEGAGPSVEAPVCPAGYTTDAAREVALLAALRGDGNGDGGTSRAPKDLPRLVAPVCFGPLRSAGVLAGSRVILRASLPDIELAPRLAHLAVHLEDQLGDGCARGLAGAVASERRARALENELRARVGLGAVPDADAAEQDYARRCADRRR